jgi:hypothetical protein
VGRHVCWPNGRKEEALTFPYIKRAITSSTKFCNMVTNKNFMPHNSKYNSTHAHLLKMYRDHFAHDTKQHPYAKFPIEIPHLKTSCRAFYWQQKLIAC